MYYHPKKATICFTVFLLLFLCYTLSAQTTFNISSKTTGDTLLTIDNNGRMGLGITVPVAGLHLVNDYGAVLSGTFGEGSIPVEGAGTRLMWYPAKSAFRVGTVNGDQWDDGNIGNYSIAIGRRTTANGSSAITLGNFTTASGNYSMAFGRGAAASGENAISIGRSIEAAGNFSIAIGIGEQGGTVVSQDTTLAIVGGRVGIHTVAPTTAFEVADTIHSSFGGFMFPDGTVQQTAASSGGGNTLDQAYDQGGAGAGRTITADAGAVTINGTGGLAVDAFIATNGSITSGGSGTEGGQLSLEDGDGQGSWIIDNQGATDNERFRIFRPAGYNPQTNAFNIISSGYVGVGTGIPTANLHVDGTDGVLFSGTYGSGSIPVEGAGTRMMWYPAKAAFRAGIVNGMRWDQDSIGVFSFATGNNCKAEGAYSIAMGDRSVATANNSIAMGYQNSATGQGGLALGGLTQASGSYSTALGRNTKSMGYASTAMGYNTEATNSYSTAMGYGTTASGLYSTAMGYGTTVQGNYSTVMGRGFSVEGSYSVGISLSDQSDLHLFQSNTMAIMGGKVGIGTTVPTADLEVEGDFIIHKNNVTISSDGDTLKLQSYTGTITIDPTGAITIRATTGDITLDANNRNLNLVAQNVNIDADNNVDIKGTNVYLNADADSYGAARVHDNVAITSPLTGTIFDGSTSVKIGD